VVGQILYLNILFFDTILDHTKCHLIWKSINQNILRNIFSLKNSKFLFTISSISPKFILSLEFMSKFRIISVSLIIQSNIFVTIVILTFCQEKKSYIKINFSQHIYIFHLNQCQVRCYCDSCWENLHLREYPLTMKLIKDGKMNLCFWNWSFIEALHCRY
jgi:hypothetical protein